MVLLGRLAVDRKEQGRSLGSNLLRDAITRTAEAAEIFGVWALLVHALHERARDFYLHHNFEPSPTEPLHLMLLTRDARKIV